MDLQKKYKVLFESNLLIKKFKKILHSDRVRKANSLPRAKHTKKGTKYLYEQNDDNNKNQFSKNRQV